MKQFKIKENGFKEIRKQTLLRTIPITLIAMSVGLVILEYNSVRNITSAVNVYPIVIPILIGTIAFGLYRGLKRQKDIYDTYVLKIDENGITREQINTPVINLSFKDIKRITKSKNGVIVIRGNSIYNSIIVPAQVEDIIGLESILNENCPVPIGFSKPLIQRLLIPIVLVVLGLWIVTYVSSNKLLVACSGTILTITLIWSVISIQVNKNIDNKTRRSSYWIILVVLSIIGVMIFKLLKPTL
jgi:hypothetical protein